LGLLDLGVQEETEAIHGSAWPGRSGSRYVEALRVRWDTFGAPSRSLKRLSESLPQRVPVLLLAGVRTGELVKLRESSKRLGRRVFLEVYDVTVGTRSTGRRLESLGAQRDTHIITQRLPLEIHLVPEYMLLRIPLLVILPVAAASFPARRAAYRNIVDALGHA
jgi:hypothetical protein